MGVARILFRGWNILRGRLREGSGGRSTRTPKKFLKFEKILLRKLRKCIIFAYFTQNITNPALIFRAFGRKIQIVGNFDKIFSKVFLRKLLIMLYFCLFYTKFYEPCFNFARVWTKNTNCWKIFDEILKILDENSIEKLTSKLFLENLMLKIEPSEITSFFYNNFFHFRGVERSRCSPWLRHCFMCFKFLLSILLWRNFNELEPTATISHFR